MLQRKNSLQSVLLSAADSLGRHSDSGRLEAELLMCHVLSRERSYLYGHPEALLSAAQIDQYHRLLARRQAGEPLAYITGVKEFWSLPFTVTKAVLIPRPETELVVELALACFPAQRPVTLADLGTGCGAIACAIAHGRPLWRVIATDCCEPALRIARSNAETLELENIDWLAGRWLCPLARRRFEIIVSNPPYVSEGDSYLMRPELAHEPRSALTSRKEGLADIQQIVSQAPDILSDGGVLILEHGYDQGPQVRRILEHRGFREVQTHLDLAGIERVTLGRWND
jgi:release factor glutamine methyltransferase